MEVLVLHQGQVVFRSQLYELFEHHQKFGHVHRLPIALGYIESHALRQVEVQLEPERLLLAVLVLQQLDPVVLITYVECLGVLLPDPANDSLRIQDGPDEKPTRFQALRDVQKESPCPLLGVEHVVHGELAGDNVEVELLLDVFQALVLSQSFVNNLRLLSRVRIDQNCRKSLSFVIVVDPV